MRVSRTISISSCCQQNLQSIPRVQTLLPGTGNVVFFYFFFFLITCKLLFQELLLAIKNRKFTYFFFRFENCRESMRNFDIHVILWFSRKARECVCIGKCPNFPSSLTTRKDYLDLSVIVETRKRKSVKITRKKSSFIVSSFLWMKWKKKVFLLRCFLYFIGDEDQIDIRCRKMNRAFTDSRNAQLTIYPAPDLLSGVEGNEKNARISSLLLLPNIPHAKDVNCWWFCCVKLSTS